MTIKHNPLEQQQIAARTEGQLVLDVRNLSVKFNTMQGQVTAVNNVSFQVHAGETVALVDESGPGKSVTSLGIMRLTPPAPRATVEGEDRLQGKKDPEPANSLALEQEPMGSDRGRGLAMVSQEPMTSF